MYSSKTVLALLYVSSRGQVVSASATVCLEQIKTVDVLFYTVYILYIAVLKKYSKFHLLHNTIMVFTARGPSLRYSTEEYCV